jgi:prepilin-type N-terminal cleavage/methylation domain-containing protein
MQVAKMIIKPNKTNRQSGFTLMEVMATVIVISIMSVTTFMLTNRSMQDNRFSAERLEATSLAHQTINQLQAINTQAQFTALTNNVNINNQANNLPGKSTQFTRTWQVTQLPNGAKQVTVNVSWPVALDDNNQPLASDESQVALTTIIEPIAPVTAAQVVLSSTNAGNVKPPVLSSGSSSSSSSSTTCTSSTGHMSSMHGSGCGSGHTMH